jgi:hypothetical protein
MILPIWLWLFICVVILAAGGVAWVRKIAVTDPQSARAVASGTAMADAKLESRCQAAVIDHEMTAPGQTSFVALLSPLEFTGAGSRARTPISLALSERTLAVTYKQGALGNVATVLINRRDISAGHAGEGPRGFAYSIQAARHGRCTILLQSEEDRSRLADWVTAQASDQH